MPTPNSEQRDFDEEFEQAIAEWREHHRLREDDAVLLMAELFRIHQRHGFFTCRFISSPCFREGTEDGNGQRLAMAVNEAFWASQAR